MRRVYYTTTNNGDGSSSVEFFETQEQIDELEEEDPETYGMGEGGSWFEISDDAVIEGINIQKVVD